MFPLPITRPAYFVHLLNRSPMNYTPISAMLYVRDAGHYDYLLPILSDDPADRGDLDRFLLTSGLNRLPA